MCFTINRNLCSVFVVARYWDVIYLNNFNSYVDLSLVFAKHDDPLHDSRFLLN